jgi:CRP/FNR family cyclic AMP-dependent transcriptional regulator
LIVATTLRERWSAGRIEALLVRGAWFGSLPRPFAQQLLAAGQIRQFAKGDIFVHANEATGLWAVLQGSVALSRIGASGNEFIFHVARPGFWLGAFGIVTGRVVDVVATAIGDATLLSIPRAEIERLVAADATYLAALSQLSMDRFARALDALEQTSRLSAVGRVAAKLVSIRSLDIDTDSAAAAMPLTISQTALALMTSLSRQSVSSALRELTRVGAISVGFKEITIVDQKRLETIAAESS